jgi:hypothetical protein
MYLYFLFSFLSINPHQPLLTSRVMPESAPRPTARIFHRSLLDSAPRSSVELPLAGLAKVGSFFSQVLGLLFLLAIPSHIKDDQQHSVAERDSAGMSQTETLRQEKRFELIGKGRPVQILFDKT